MSDWQGMYYEAVAENERLRAEVERLETDNERFYQAWKQLLPLVPPSEEALKALEEGKRAIREGRYSVLDPNELLDDEDRDQSENKVYEDCHICDGRGEHIKTERHFQCGCGASWVR